MIPNILIITSITHTHTYIHKKKKKKKTGIRMEFVLIIPTKWTLFMFACIYRPNGVLRYANNSHYKKETTIRKQGLCRFYHPPSPPLFLLSFLCCPSYHLLTALVILNMLTARFIYSCIITPPFFFFFFFFFDPSLSFALCPCYLSLSQRVKVGLARAIKNHRGK